MSLMPDASANSTSGSRSRNSPQPTLWCVRAANTGSARPAPRHNLQPNTADIQIAESVIRCSKASLGWQPLWQLHSGDATLVLSSKECKHCLMPTMA